MKQALPFYIYKAPWDLWNDYNQTKQLKTLSPDPGGHIANCEDHPCSEIS